MVVCLFLKLYFYNCDQNLATVTIKTLLEKTFKERPKTKNSADNLDAYLHIGGRKLISKMHNV